MQVFNNFFEILLAPMEPKNLILLNFPKKAYHAHPPPPPHSEGYSPMSCSDTVNILMICKNNDIKKLASIYTFKANRL